MPRIFILTIYHFIHFYNFSWNRFFFISRSPRSESQPEAPVMHNNEKLRSCCSTSRSAADRQTTGPNKREVASHVRTRSLDRSSPRVGRADNRGSSVNHTVQTDMKNLQDYLPVHYREGKTLKFHNF